jgi:hypothetical protein
MKLLLSITTKTEGSVDLNKMFVVYDTELKSYKFLKFNNDLRVSANSNRGMGMCYFENFWYAGIFCVEHRVGSRLLIVDLSTGEQSLHKLSLTKAIHSVRPYGKCGQYNMILACSTQNDCISIITTHNNNIITEDIFFDYLSKKRRLANDWSKEYVFDDLLHANDCLFHEGDFYACMFHDYKLYDEAAEQYIANRERFKKRTKEEKEQWFKNQRRLDWRKDVAKKFGAVYDLTRNKLLYKTVQPHTLIIDQFKNRVFCESYTYKLINITQNKETQCKGFTRGLCEDTERGGYWVGSSYHRVFSSLIPGAVIQFVNYNMEVEETIDLSKLGLEIYDIIPYKEGLPI